MKPFILCMGLPGSGKSTTSKLLENKLDRFKRICLPEVRVSLGLSAYGKDGMEGVKKYIEELNSKIEKGISLIFDRAALRQEKRIDVYEWAKKMKANVIVILHTAPSHVLKNRIESREFDKGVDKFQNDITVVDKYKKRWSNPCKDDFDKYPQVSLLKYDTEKNTLSIIHDNHNSNNYIKKIIDILTSN